jgi:hypothetical protein
MITKPQSLLLLEARVNTAQLRWQTALRQHGSYSISERFAWKRLSALSAQYVRHVDGIRWPR